MLYAVAMLASVALVLVNAFFVERPHADTSSVQHKPHAKPDDIHIHTDHAPRKSGDGIGEMVLHPARTSRLEAQLNNGANVPLNDLAQCRIIVGVVGFVLLVQAALLHTTDVLPLCCHIIHHTLSRYNLLQYRALPPNGLEISGPPTRARLPTCSDNAAGTAPCPFRPRGG